MNLLLVQALTATPDFEGQLFFLQDSTLAKEYSDAFQNTRTSLCFSLQDLENLAEQTFYFYLMTLPKFTFQVAVDLQDKQGRWNRDFLMIQRSQPYEGRKSYQGELPVKKLLSTVWEKQEKEGAPEYARICLTAPYLEFPSSETPPNKTLLFSSKVALGVIFITTNPQPPTIITSLENSTEKLIFLGSLWIGALGTHDDSSTFWQDQKIWMRANQLSIGDILSLYDQEGDPLIFHIQQYHNQQWTSLKANDLPFYRIETPLTGLIKFSLTLQNSEPLLGAVSSARARLFLVRW